MEIRKLYHITNCGSEDKTEMEIELTDEEYNFLKRVFDALNEKSQDMCMPSIFVEEV